MNLANKRLTLKIKIDYQEDEDKYFVNILNAIKRKINTIRVHDQPNLTQETDCRSTIFSFSTLRKLTLLTFQTTMMYYSIVLLVFTFL